MIQAFVLILFRNMLRNEDKYHVSFLGIGGIYLNKIC
jgi:hypothetical protein